VLFTIPQCVLLFKQTQVLQSECFQFIGASNQLLTAIQVFLFPVSWLFGGRNQVEPAIIPLFKS